MNAPLSSSEETQRVAALSSYNILDSLPEQEYDDITQLAALICGTPIALISLIDEQRQWFKANKGLPLPQTPREQSFCAHNLNQPTGPLIVADARLDERFAHNPLVTGQPHIVFYAGVPLVDPQGHTLGSLCVIDQQVRQLTPDQVGALTRLARQVMSLLSLRKTNQALLDAQGSIVRQQLDIDFAIQAVGLGVWELDRTTNLVLWDDRCRALFGIAKENALPYEQAIQYIHPDDVERVNQAVEWAVNPQSDGHYDVTYRTIGADDGQLRWVRFIGKSYFQPDGQLDRFAGVAQDVTRQTESQQALMQSETRFRSVVEQAPMAIGQLKGRDMIVELGNERLFEVWGKDASVIGKPLLEALPELEGQPFMSLLEDVYDTGTPYFGTGVLAKLIRQDRLEEVYFDFSYSPIRGMNGQISGILILAIEVTGQVLARKAIESSEFRFRSLVLEAPFAIAVYETADLVIGVANEAMIQLWGKTNAVIGQPLAEALPELAEQPFIPLLNQVFSTGQPYRTEEQSANLLIEGHMQTRWFNFVYQPLFNTQGQVYAILNMAVDITDKYLARQQLQLSEQNYRDLAADLDNRVQVRTRELVLANQDLLRSNDNLQQFAYVASHDLQEPLRKIQSFATLISEHMAGQLDESTQMYLERITAAGARMSTLIKDLLAYSRISTRQQAFGAISLQAVVRGVLGILDWEIGQSGAKIQVDELPVVKGDESQLSQLFQNLLTNALKFVPSGQPPQIHIQYFYRSMDELPAEVRPAHQAAFYHQISVSDQGVGFDVKFLDRIFQVFQRLHGKNEFAGTGVGLAICQRVVENHGGGITASSQPGQGATFCIYLPA